MRSSRRAAAGRDRGAGQLSMAFGVFMFLVMLTMTVQIAYHLYTTSVVTGIVVDAARDVAERDGPSSVAAEADLRSRFGDDIDVELRTDGDRVVAEVRWQTRSLFPTFGDARAFGVLDRRIEVRIEEQQ